MTSERIKEIQETTAYPESVSVQQALLQVWNECEQEQPDIIADRILKELGAELSRISKDELIEIIKG